MAKKTVKRKKPARPAAPRRASAARPKTISFKSAKNALARLHQTMKKTGGRSPSPDLAEALSKVATAVNLVREACMPAVMARAFAAPKSRKR